MATVKNTVGTANLQDRAQIVDVISAVTLYADLLEFEVAMSMYAPGATLLYKSNLFQGEQKPVAARDFWNHVTTFLPGFDRTFHQVSNFDIRVEGDTALSRSMVSACHRLDSELWAQGGLYEHQMIRTSEGWRIRHQTYTQFWERGADLSAKAGARFASRSKGAVTG